MESDLGAVFKSIKRMWHTTTGGGLAVLGPGDRPVQSIQGRKLPAAVRRALVEESPLDALKTGKGYWWVTSPSPGLLGRVQLVAWAPNDGGLDHLLQIWTDMLAFSFGEKAVADQLTKALVDAWDRLTFLYELTHIAGQVTELPDMLSSIVHLLAQVVSAEEVFLVTGDDSGWESVTASGDLLPQPAALVENIPRAGRPVGLAEIQPALKRAASPLAQVGDMLVAPLLGEGNLSGVIGLLDSRQSCFDSSDMQLLASVAEQVGALIEAVRARASRLESQRLEHELEIAAGIQASLLPAGLPPIAGLELAAYLSPARMIGGDFYDIAEAKTGETMLLLADVAGKGTPAAILTALVHAIFHAEVSHRRDPATLLQVINRILQPDLEKAEAFVTAAIVRLESESIGFSYASAGHVDAALWRNGEQRVEFLPATGLPLGIDPTCNYHSQQVALNPGDVLYLYSDGVTEAENPEGEILGLTGLSDIINATNPAQAKEQIRVIVESLDVYRRDLPLRDDVTLLLVRALPERGDSREVIPFVIPAELTAVSQLVDLVRNLDQTLPISNAKHRRQIADDFALALSEVVTNQVEHAFQGRKGQIHGRVIVEVDKLVADLYDSGVPFQPSKSPKIPFDPDDPPERGYGLRLVRGLLDIFECRRLEGERNHWHLVKMFSGVDKL